jgi:orotate phosphoribosyltransferase
MHSILNILQITESLYEQKLVDESVLEKVKNQISE